MQSFAIALAYLAMIFTPCLVATYGDVLVLPRFTFFRRRRAARQTFILEDLVQEAFTAPAALPAFGNTFAIALHSTQTDTKTDAFTAATARVAARLAQMVAARQQALQAAAEAIAAEAATHQAAEAPIFAATPTASALEALYAPIPAPTTLQMPPPAPIPIEIEQDIYDTLPERIAA